MKKRYTVSTDQAPKAARVARDHGLIEMIRVRPGEVRVRTHLRASTVADLLNAEGIGVEVTRGWK